MLQAFRGLVWLCLPSEHYSTHDDVGEALVVHAPDAAGVQKGSPYRGNLGANSASPLEELAV